MSSPILEPGDVLIAVHRWGFDEDVARDSVGRVEAFTDGVALVDGRTRVDDEFAGKVIVEAGGRKELLALPSGTRIVYRLDRDIRARLPAMARRRTFECPHCGADVARGALACPECGSDAESGWSEEADAWAGDLPTGYGEDEDFDYEEALRAEGLAGDGRPAREALRRRRVAAVCLTLALALLAWLVLR